MGEGTSVPAGKFTGEPVQNGSASAHKPVGTCAARKPGAEKIKKNNDTNSTNLFMLDKVLKNNPMLFVWSALGNKVKSKVLMCSYTLFKNKSF
jgi:hypothetical protein